MTVDPDLAVAIHAVEINERQPILVSSRQRERLTIPTDAARQCSSAWSRRILLAELTLYAPVMRQVQAPPP